MARFSRLYRRQTVVHLAMLLSLVSCTPKPQTNVILFIVDDLGWADTGIYGSSFYVTPNIDLLINNSTKFTSFYAASPVCSPTRASIMSGKHPARVKITNWIGGEKKGQLLQAEYRRQLPLEEVTIAERFREAGYATGFVGKWHLGGDGFLPEQQGFDVNIGGHAAGQPGSYFYPYKHPTNTFWDVPDLPVGQEGEYLTDRLTEESLSFIRKNAKKPFLLVHAYYSVHTPLQAKEELVRSFRQKAEQLDECRETVFTPESSRASTRRCQNHPVYAAMIQSMDQSVGKILSELDAIGIADHTAVVFVSDNGGLSTLAAGRTSMPTSNDPLRAGKGWLYEGGIRVPFSIMWPGKTEAGGIRTEPASTTDIYATLQDLAGLSSRADDARDGMSLVPILSGVTDPEDRPLFWHFPHYHGSENRPSGAVRLGRYKLIEWFEDGSIELYDLEADASETKNIVAIKPDTADKLLRLLHDWRTEIGAEMPVPNPDWPDSGASGE